MILWRISEHAELDGAGGLRTPGRWHKLGQRVVYCAPNPATALVEAMVHIEIDPEDLPDTLQYLEIEAPDELPLETLNLESLGRHWRTNLVATRRAGGEWLQSKRSPLLRVPSVVVPETWNVLINPQHPESTGIQVVRVHRQGVDPRLLR